MIKEKIQKLKEINDCSNVQLKKESELRQCPKCYQLFSKNHTCGESRYVCTICRVDLYKKRKKVRKINGFVYSSRSSKKYYRLINSVICHQCACNIIKEMKKGN